MKAWLVTVLMVLTTAVLWWLDRLGKRVMAERDHTRAQKAGLPPPTPRPAGKRRLKIGGTGEEIEV